MAKVPARHDRGDREPVLGTASHLRREATPTRVRLVASGRGAAGRAGHQLARPARRTSAGTRITRMIVASTMIATAAPTPRSLRAAHPSPPTTYDAVRP